MWMVRSRSARSRPAAAREGDGRPASVIAAASGRRARAAPGRGSRRRRRGRRPRAARAHVVVAHEGGPCLGGTARSRAACGGDRGPTVVPAARRGGERGAIGPLLLDADRGRVGAAVALTLVTSSGPTRAGRRSAGERAQRPAGLLAAPPARRGSRPGRGRRTSARAPRRAVGPRLRRSASKRGRSRPDQLAGLAPGGGPVVAAIAGRSSEAITLSSIPVAKNCHTFSGGSPDRRVTSRTMSP